MRYIGKLAGYMSRNVSAFALLLVVGFAVVTWTLPVSGTGGSKQQSTRTIRKDLIESTELKTASQSSGLEIVKVEKHLNEDSIHVWLQNNSGKMITAYQVGIGARNILTDLVQADVDSNVLRPGMVIQERYVIQAELETKGINVLSVMYEDGTTEGVPKNVKQIKQYRQGMKIEREHVLRLLKNVASASESEMRSRFANIGSLLPALSDEEKEKLPFFIKIGYLDQLHIVVAQMGSLANKLQGPSDANPQSAKNTSLSLRQELQGYVQRYVNTSRLLGK